jgi:hypothetical protein
MQKLLIMGVVKIVLLRVNQSKQDGFDFGIQSVKLIFGAEMPFAPKVTE